MKRSVELITRRDFLRGTACTGLAMAIHLPSRPRTVGADNSTTKVVLVRNERALNAEHKLDPDIIQQMLDEAVKTLMEKQEVTEAWRTLFIPDDTVGIKSNVWHYLPTPEALEQAIKKRINGVGVPDERIAIDDRGVLRNPIFLSSDALINVRPVRTHFWSGIGGCIKNYIMFVPNPSRYHRNSCEDLASIWALPIVRNKTKLNVLCALQPLFHGRGPHHFSRKYLWDYKGLIVGTDPVAVDTIGLRLIMAKRLAHFGRDRRLETLPHHIAAADKKHHMGTSDLQKIELIRLGWDEDVLI
jgi:hypothetical protein